MKKAQIIAAIGVGTLLIIFGGPRENSESDQSLASLANSNAIRFTDYDAALFVLAAESGDGNVVKQYLIDGFDPNTKDQNQNTALMAACLNGHTHIIKLLLKAEANPHVTNAQGLSAIHFSQMRGDPHTSDILLAAHPTPPQSQ